MTQFVRAPTSDAFGSWFAPCPGHTHTLIPKTLTMNKFVCGTKLQICFKKNPIHQYFFVKQREA